MAGLTTEERAAVILAGGNGARLKGLVRNMTGQDVPKQFCSLLGEETLLDRTRRRAALAVAPKNTLFVVNQAHGQYYESILRAVPKANLVIQPDSRGTAPAMLLALTRLAAMVPDASVVIFPADQFVSDEREFMRHVETAFDAVNARPELTVLLGMEPSHPDTSYGWIEPTQRINFEHYSLYRVGALCATPLLDDAVRLLKRGWLWNSKVVIGRASTILGLIMVAAPELYAAFAPVRARFPEPPSPRSIANVYKNLAVTSFTEHVLAANPVNLAALPVSGIRWINLAEPQRIRQTWNQLGLKPLWSIGS